MLRVVLHGAGQLIKHLTRSSLVAGAVMLVATTLVSTLVSPAAQAGYASIVVDAESGRVLYARNADTKNYPASLTKMMTLYMAFEALENGKLALDQGLKVSRRAAGMPASKLGLKAGETIRVQDAILSLVTKSANDSAVVIAESLGGKETNFARQMTKKARALGMKNTSFRNASGLPNRRQLSTARDMATLAKALLRDFPNRYHYFSTKQFSYKGIKHKNHNRLLKSYEGTDGIKTGYIRASGFNLVASVVRDDRRLIAVVFGGKSTKSRDRHIAKLLDRSFAKVMVASNDKKTEKVKVAKAVTTPTPPPVPKAKPVVTKKPTAIKQVAKAPAPAKTAKPLSKQTAPRQTANGRWGVQVGAYYGYKPAKKAADRVSKQFPVLLGDSQVMITHIKGKRGRIYRARLVGLDKPRANKACEKLESAKIDCLVVQVRRNVNIAANVVTPNRPLVSRLPLVGILPLASIRPQGNAEN